jgi:3-phosphoshikimate 1-carboxyvinyltransferase
VMRWFGHDDVAVHDDLVTVGPGRYRAAEVFIEPDASSAGYPLAIAAITGGSVEVAGLGEQAIQGDTRFADLLAAMGCSVERTAASVRVTGPGEGAPLAGLDVDMADISDLVPTVAAVALFCATPTRIRGVGFIRGKESDRLGDLARELRTLRGDVEETDDGLLIRPSSVMLRGGTLGTHHDHRLAMTFGVIGSVVAGVEIEDPSVVSKSWPGYWAMLEGLA